ncbi:MULTISPECIES: SDR family oxidoreductase [unclassified Streptomyces]|uniref:SDR family NAD(P)-dependent oxidoreductase n=1 Tax=unclassified Streptomyces TaxID=2593676 RepID=UPI0003778D02|nr:MULTISPECIES: SDR family oxidoreductase [unclassified Streptomyces]MYT27897.1 SDR family oxidoreductase [Streptomyces sp. SID8354]
MARTILVTGGGTGIGRALAEHFAAVGDHVVLTGRRPGPLKEAADALPGATGLVCDHADPAALLRLAAELPERLDILVNNAGGQTDFDADGATDLASYARDFRANLDANLLSAALTTRAVDDRLAAGGAVIHIGSIAADQGSGSYGAAKAGLASWNIDLARTLGPRGITANVVSPGYITDTEFFRDQLADERRERLIADTATGCPGSPDDIIGAVAFLASPGARHITGQVLNVNGGAHPTR